nr:TauD/TfdA family dioxygenase [Kibdelosporangium sp. MJ126-NF4]CEL13323.1 putative oxygenase (putative secreted protein) [Kibdelosporangium sp. MJ126-NF4]CTQ99014.1 FIG01124451: hypothetical protein [Kibdelosporangium sp. MJ126-NF4]
MVVPGDGGTVRHAARMLADIATGLARDGATAEDVCWRHFDGVPHELATVLAPHLHPPDRSSGVRVVRGLLAELGDPGPTPRQWGEPRSEGARALDIAILLTGSVLGRVFGWEGQQDGHLVHDILPSRGFEDSQVGASSLTSLAWHTEDSFHPGRAALLLLACVRDQDGIGSRLASIRTAGLSAQQLALLRRREVQILPDDSYPPLPDGSSRPQLVATVWDADDGICLRYDPSYSRIPDAGPEFRAAYAALGAALDRCGHTVPIGRGDILVIDNDVAVHGRSAFTPRYDGTDRWLKRVLIGLPRDRPAYECSETGCGQRQVESFLVRETP